MRRRNQATAAVVPVTTELVAATAPARAAQGGGGRERLVAGLAKGETPRICDCVKPLKAKNLVVA
jgi:hypothetical protein